MTKQVTGDTLLQRYGNNCFSGEVTKYTPILLKSTHLISIHVISMEEQFKLT